jgi:adenylate cyclase
VLKKESFSVRMKNIFGEGHQEREILNLILSSLDNNIIGRWRIDAVLYEMLQNITLKIGELLNADRATIFLFDQEQNELWAIVAKDENGKSLEIRFPAQSRHCGRSSHGEKKW